MGCGISKFGPEEVVEATTNSPHYSKTTTSNCFTRPLVQEHPPNHSHHNAYSSDGRSKKGDFSPEEEDDDVKIKMRTNVKRGEVEENDQKILRARTETEFEDHINDDENESSCREICRGGSPSFREYCIDSDSRSRSMASEGTCEGDSRKWNPDKEKGVENETGKKEGRGKGIRKVLQRGKSGGVKNFTSNSRRQQQQQPPPPQSTDFASPNHETSHKLLAKAS